MMALHSGGLGGKFSEVWDDMRAEALNFLDLFASFLDGPPQRSSQK